MGFNWGFKGLMLKFSVLEELGALPVISLVLMLKLTSGSSDL